MSANGTHLAITNPLVLYRSLLATQRIKPDPAQHRLAIHLQKLYERLIDYEPVVEYEQRLKQLSRAIGDEQDAPRQRQQYAAAARKTTTFGTRGLWRSVIAKKEQRNSLALTRVLTSHEAAMNLQSPKGLMLHGEVGTGKSMLVDLFADCLPNRKKRRWHFNTFMLDTIARLEMLRRERVSGAHVGAKEGWKDEYSLLWLARDLVEKSPILFLDEFQLPDRAASKILSNLMTSFFQLGGVLIATSNRMPEELAKAAGMEFERPVGRLSRLGWRLGMSGIVGRDDGPGQKGEFGAFLEVLRARCEVWEMDGKRDYRRLEDGNNIVEELERSVSAETTSTVSAETGAGGGHSTPLSSQYSTTEEEGSTSETSATMPKYYFLTSSDSPAAIDAALSTALSLSESNPWTSSNLTVYGRQIYIQRQHSGTAFFTFAELCGATLGPADYITLASTFHTIILTNIPVLTFLQKNEARRMITLLDALYEARCRLFVTAEAAPDDVFFPAPKGISAEANPGGEEVLDADALHPETYSEIHQDLTSPFRPNISTYSPTLPVDALEDDPPNRFRRPGSSYTDERKSADIGRSPDFANIRGLTGEDEVFAVKRVTSRLWEMCSGRWWERGQYEADGVHGSEKGEIGWWRPLPSESRHWERPTSGLNSPPTGPLSEMNHSPEISDAKLVGEASAEEQKQMETIFKDGASLFRTSPDAPPKFGLTHAWGMVQWGKKAGAWGKGVEGLEQREKEKKATDEVANGVDRKG